MATAWVFDLHPSILMFFFILFFMSSICFFFFTVPFSSIPHWFNGHSTSNRIAPLLLTNSPSLRPPIPILFRLKWCLNLEPLKPSRVFVSWWRIMGFDFLVVGISHPCGSDSFFLLLFWTWNHVPYFLIHSFFFASVWDIIMNLAIHSSKLRPKFPFFFFQILLLWQTPLTPKHYIPKLHPGFFFSFLYLFFFFLSFSSFLLFFNQCILFSSSWWYLYMEWWIWCKPPWPDIHQIKHGNSSSWWERAQKALGPASCSAVWYKIKIKKVKTFSKGMEHLLLGSKVLSKWVL